MSSFAATNVKSNRFLEKYVKSPEINLGEVSGEVVLDVGQSTKYRMTIVGDVVISVTSDSVTDELELYILNEGFAITWPENISLQNAVIPYILTYFKFKKVGNAWDSVAYNAFTNNPYTPITVDPKCCISLYTFNSEIKPPINTRAYPNYTLSTCLCCNPSYCATVFTYPPPTSLSCTPGKPVASYNNKFIAMECATMWSCSCNWQCYCCASFNCVNLLSYYNMGGQYIPFGVSLLNCNQTCYYFNYSGTPVYGPGCCNWGVYRTPLGYDDSGMLYYTQLAFNGCSEYDCRDGSQFCPGTSCMSLRVACVPGITRSTVTDTTFASQICDVCEIYITCAFPGYGLMSGCQVAEFPKLVWATCDTAFVNMFNRSCMGIMIKRTGDTSWSCATYTGWILSKAESAPYYVSLQSRTETCCFYPCNLAWNILYDSSEGTNNAISLTSALQFSQCSELWCCYNWSYVHEGMVMTGDGCHVITTKRPVTVCCNWSWWIPGATTCLYTCVQPCVIIYCRCAGSTSFCTNPGCITSCYTDANNWRWAGPLRDGGATPWIDGGRGSNWWIENVEVVCNVAGTLSCYGVCYDGASWVVSTVSYGCLCSTLGYDYACAFMRRNGSVPKLPFPIRPCCHFGLQCHLFDVNCEAAMCWNGCCILFPNTTQRYVTNQNFNSSLGFICATARDAGVCEKKFAGKPYTEKCREQ